MGEAPPTSSRLSLPRLSRCWIGRSPGLRVRKGADVAGRGSLSVLWQCFGSCPALWAEGTGPPGEGWCVKSVS